MSLYRTSYNHKKGMLVIFIVLLAVLILPFEFYARTHRWEGGFLRLIDPEHVNDIHELNAAYDIFIVGSSRAKESVRPAVLEAVFKQQKVYNYGCHSCVSPLVIKSMLEMTALSKFKMPKNIIITVEPMHFSSKYNHPTPKSGDTLENPSSSKLHEFSLTLKNANTNILNKINKQTETIVNKILSSTQATNRNFLHLWVYGMYQGTIKFLNTSDPNSFLQELYVYTFGKGAKWHSVVVHTEKGYEGHILEMKDPTLTRKMAFQDHIKNYQEYVLPNYQDGLIQPFTDDLIQLKKLGVNIILVRLPIYTQLYKIEEAIVSNFNDKMLELSKTLNIQYFDMNKINQDITEDPICFTDASHMNHEKTDYFSKKLAQIIEPFLVK